VEVETGRIVTFFLVVNVGNVAVGGLDFVPFVFCPTPD